MPGVFLLFISSASAERASGSPASDPTAGQNAVITLFSLGKEWEGRMKSDRIAARLKGGCRNKILRTDFISRKKRSVSRRKKNLDERTPIMKKAFACRRFPVCEVCFAGGMEAALYAVFSCLKFIGQPEWAGGPSEGTPALQQRADRRRVQTAACVFVCGVKYGFSIAPYPGASEREAVEGGAYLFSGGMEHEYQQSDRRNGPASLSGGAA